MGHPPCNHLGTADGALFGIYTIDDNDNEQQQKQHAERQNRNYVVLTTIIILREQIKIQTMTITDKTGEKNFFHSSCYYFTVVCVCMCVFVLCASVTVFGNTLQIANI